MGARQLIWEEVCALALPTTFHIYLFFLCRVQWETVAYNADDLLGVV